MRIYCRLIFFTCLWICFQSQSVLACRYNVRETGFIDLGYEPYNFYVFVNKDTPEEITSTITNISGVAFLDCNIRVSIINIDLQKEHSSLKYLSQLQIQSFPVAILVSPDERYILITVQKDNEPFEKSFRSAINNTLYFLLFGKK